MHSWFATADRRAVKVWIVVGLSATGLARERGPRVEVVCPSPPVPVRIDKQQVLVYELRVTNFDAGPLRPRRSDTKHVSVPWVNSIPPGNAVTEFGPVRKERHASL